MPSDTDIANRSLRIVGGSRVTSLTQGTKNANAVNDIYADLRDEMMDYPWNFATKRVKLARSATTPTFGFDYAYTLPSDWIRTVSVHDNVDGAGTVLYREEQNATQNALVTDVENVYLRYVARVEDPNLWSVAFRSAFINALACELAIPIAGSKALFEQLRDKSKKTLSKAKSSDSIQSFPERRPTGSWVSIRNITSYSDHYHY